MSQKENSAEFLQSITFDREIPLDDLLNAVNKTKLAKVLAGILKDSFRIINLQNKCLLGDDSDNYETSRAIILELEDIGYLQTNSTDPASLTAAIDCIVLQITFAQKYLMASALHIEAVQEDYNKLCKEHEQLLASEANYKNLCEHLDEKVKEQVATIEQSQLKMFESEKMAAIGHLAAGVAHEINNPIGFIKSNLNSAKSYLADLMKLGKLIEEKQGVDAIASYCEDIDLTFILEDFTELLDESIDGSDRVTSIVSDLKLFSSVDSNAEETIDISGYIRSTCNVAQTALDKPVSIELKESQLPNLRCRPGYIGQVLLALIMNAADAYDDEGKVVVHTAFEDNRVHISIEDYGKGIPQEIINKVFDPFFTTKEVGKGKGLGLTACKDIIHSHQGEIRIQSEPGKGTKVSFWLPA